MSNQCIKTFNSINDLKAAIKDSSINYWNKDTNITVNPLYDETIVYEKETKSLFFGKYGFFEEANLQLGNASVPVNFRKATTNDISKYTKVIPEAKTNISTLSKVVILPNVEEGNNNTFTKYDPKQFRTKLAYVFSDFGN